MLVHYSHYDSHLVFSEALNTEHRVRCWASTFICTRCWRRWRFPYVTHTNRQIYCRSCIMKI
eukprot:NODE_25601_length_581_cov_3.303965.p2 GENE.NODE_25601_length_581_cov_3.303965~~NODE_25601_length_581_cov_3.303965.p2  ORF type:complete len:62 (+),score=11.70 NODE_25601_length_581_cov_3.303965:255-440(+)